jgi:membrane associated rhomboid family serine protease
MGSSLPAVGASGAISGVLGFYFIWFPYNRVRTWIFLFPIFMNVVELPARLVLGCYVLFDNVLPLLFTHGVGGVAHGAHIGGFVAGAALAFLGPRRQTT